jgi:hypothetical protein
MFTLDVDAKTAVFASNFHQITSDLNHGINLNSQHEEVLVYKLYQLDLKLMTMVQVFLEMFDT